VSFLALAIAMEIPNCKLMEALRMMGVYERSSDNEPEKLTLPNKNSRPAKAPDRCFALMLPHIDRYAQDDMDIGAFAASLRPEPRTCRGARKTFTTACQFPALA
jgi:hypothetical protein